MTPSFRPPHGIAFLIALCVALSGCGTTPERTSPAIPVTGVGFVPAIDPLPLIRDAADQEALYALAGGLKPMSSGFWQASFAVDEPNFVELEQVRHALGVLRNDTWYADVQVFDKVYEGIIQEIDAIDNVFTPTMVSPDTPSTPTSVQELGTWHPSGMILNKTLMLDSTRPWSSQGLSLLTR